MAKFPESRKFIKISEIVFVGDLRYSVKTQSPSEFYEIRTNCKPWSSYNDFIYNMMHRERINYCNWLAIAAIFTTSPCSLSLHLTYKTAQWIWSSFEYISQPKLRFSLLLRCSKSYQGDLGEIGFWKLMILKLWEIKNLH